MAQVIARIYAAADKAAAAAAEVRGLGYGDSEVFVCGPSAGAAKADLAAGLAQAGLAKEAAEGCADEVVKGRSVVIVHAAFGGGAKATAALEKFAPIAAPPAAAAVAAEKPAKKRSFLFTGPTKHEGFFTGNLKHDDATPLSSYFKLPTLLNSATPFSDWLKAPTLKEFNSNVKLSDEPAPLSKKLGVAVLRDDPTPLSSKLNIAVLKD